MPFRVRCKNCNAIIFETLNPDEYYNKLCSTQCPVCDRIPSTSDIQTAIFKVTALRKSQSADFTPHSMGKKAILERILGVAA